jgi:leader peptidase (prepilin peptidase)/N-methyltransferase
MAIWLIILVIVLGLCWGSFLTVVAYRIDDLRSVILSRSQCPHCKKQLKPTDMVPVFSFVLLGGRCRFCKKNISFIYPITEIVSAVFFVLIYLRFGLTFQSLFLLLSLSALVVACVNDILSKEVGLQIFIFGIIFALVFRFWGDLNFLRFQNLIFSALSCIALPLIFALISRERWMGYGDVLFALWIGSLVSYPSSILSVFIAFLGGALFGIIELSIWGKKKENKIPFGPFLALGGITGLFFGASLMTVYLEVLGI